MATLDSNGMEANASASDISIESIMTTGSSNPGQLHHEVSPLRRLISGEVFGLAQTYWTLYIIGGLLFFTFGSLLAAERNWIPYVTILITTVAYSFLLLTGVRKYYRGSDPGKALGRIGMLFLLLNLTNVLLTLSFI